jgi:acyl carrier protein
MAKVDLIRQFVKSNLVVFDDDVAFADDDNIFELGLVDSPFAIELVLFIEEEFGIHILDSDLDIHNFSSVKRIAEFVKRKRGE